MQAAKKSEDDLAFQTLHFYESNAQLYAEQTRGTDLAHLYKPFLASIPKGGKILDVGCGGGRDLRRFVDEGFEAIGVEPSEKLAAIARQFSGCKVLVSGVEDLSINHEFDGAWACASLIHLSRRKLPSALVNISMALRSRGILFVSMRIGSGEIVMEDGRFVARYSSEELCNAIQRAGFELVNVWISTDSLPARHSLFWVNAIARKLSEA